MQLHKSQVNSAKGVAKPSSWDEAIQEAERKLRTSTTRTKQLEAAIRTFRAHKSSGLPWPRTKSATRN